MKMDRKKRRTKDSKNQRQKTSKININYPLFQEGEISYDSKTDHPFYLP